MAVHEPSSEIVEGGIDAEGAYWGLLNDIRKEGLICEGQSG